MMYIPTVCAVFMMSHNSAVYCHARKYDSYLGILSLIIKIDDDDSRFGSALPREQINYA